MKGDRLFFGEGAIVIPCTVEFQQLLDNVICGE